MHARIVAACCEKEATIQITQYRNGFRYIYIYITYYELLLRAFIFLFAWLGVFNFVNPRDHICMRSNRLMYAQIRYRPFQTEPCADFIYTQTYIHCYVDIMCVRRRGTVRVRRRPRVGYKLKIIEDVF